MIRVFLVRYFQKEVNTGVIPITHNELNYPGGSQSLRRYGTIYVAGIVAVCCLAAPSEETLTVQGITGNPGGTLVYAARTELKTLNPAVANDNASREVLHRINADLIHINRETQKTEPALAKSWTVSPDGHRPYISISIGGREDDCWNPNTDQGIVLAAISDVERHFNIDRHGVVLGGYSSGGDLAYRLAFYHSLEFAGVLAENTSPFRDTGSTAAQSLAAATWKFHVVHLAHTEDGTYPIGPVESEISRLQAAGFPVQLVKRPGTHYDNPSPGVPGTDADLQTLLLPHLSDGWRSP